jgi:hypothetical protein
MTNPTAVRREPYDLGSLPRRGKMRTVDERVVRSRLATIFKLAIEVERWPELLSHYRSVRFRERASDDGGLVEMSANRPFGPMQWPTWWVSQMSVQRERSGGGDDPRIRFRHVEGTRVRIVHVWNGPRWPLVGGVAATSVIGPLFVHGIASRTLEGLARVAEREPI